MCIFTRLVVVVVVVLQDVALLDKLMREDVEAGKLPLLLVANAGQLCLMIQFIICTWLTGAETLPEYRNQIVKKKRQCQALLLRLQLIPQLLLLLLIPFTTTAAIIPENAASC